MSSSHDLSSDEYVAKLLADDAKQSSIKYSSIGLSALLPKRPTKAAPKPNTRFLRTILRETDTHNVALQKKEVLEARIRLRNIRDAQVEEAGSAGRERKRRHTDREEIERHIRGHKRRRHGTNDSPGEKPSGRDTEQHRHRYSRRSTRDEDDSNRGDRIQHRRHHHGSQKHKEAEGRPGSRERNDHRRGRRKSPAASSDTGALNERGNRSRSERTGNRGNQLRSDERPRHSKAKSHSNQNTFDAASASPPPVSLPCRKSPQRKPRSPSPSTSSSSDPLEEIVGPLPPTRAHKSNSNSNPNPTYTQTPLSSRGRNAYRPTAKSAIDTHFNPTYDPTYDLDLELNSEAEEERNLQISNHSKRQFQSATTATQAPEDWDVALEALQDRLLWRKRGAQRLRDVGFRETEVERWKEQQLVRQRREHLGAAAGAGSGSGSVVERDVGDVRWRKVGEEREWDVGKFIADDDEEEKEQKEEEGQEVQEEQGGGERKRKKKKKVGRGEVLVRPAWAGK